MEVVSARHTAVIPLRIALVLPAYLPAKEYGGPIAKVRALAIGLRAIGHEPHIWCANYGANRGRLRAGQVHIDEIPIHYLGRVISYRWSPVVPRALTAPKTTAIDIAHCFGLWDGLTPFAALGFRQRRTPYVLELLGMYPPVLERHRFAKRAYDILVARSYIEGSAMIVANSEMEAVRLAESTTKEIVIRKNPIHLPEVLTPQSGLLRSQLGLSSGEPILGWVGRISMSKGLDVLVDALRFMPRHHLAIVGPDDGDGAAALLDGAIVRNGVQDRVHIMGPIWGTDRDLFLASIDVFVLPSVFESFGNAALEAASVGLPVVVSRGVGAGKWLSDVGAAIVAPLEPAALAAAILCALKADREDRQRVLQTVRAAVSPDRIAAEQVSVYMRVLLSS